MPDKIHEASHPPFSYTIEESIAVPKSNYIHVLDILKETCSKLSHHKKRQLPPTTVALTPEDKLQSSGNGNESYSNFEDILEAVGGFGNYQLFVVILLLSLEIPTAFVTFIPIFIGRVPQTWNCGNVTMSLAEVCGLCKNPIPLLEDAEESIVAQWGLICDKEWVADFVTSIQMLGMFFGSVFGSQFADWYGRRYGFLGSTILLTVGSMASTVAGNPYAYAVARFLCGAGVTSFMNVTLVGVVEVMPTKWRSFSNCVGPTGEGIMILSILAHFIRPWRTLYLATLAPFALIVVIYPLVPESPRWLLKQGRIDEATAILQRMARMNGRYSVTISTPNLRNIVEKEGAQSSNSPDKRWTYLDFVKDPQLRITSVYNMAIWFAWSLTYYGISFNIKNIGGDIYTNVFFVGCANAVGQRCALLLNNSLGRRKSLLASMTFCAVFLVALAIIIVLMDHSNVPNLVILSFCLLTQFGMASARSAARLISGESFPTAVRTMGMGIGGITANIAGILTPQLAYLGGRWPALPFFTFAFVSVGGSMISFMMAETMGHPLDEEDTSADRKNEEDLEKPSTLHAVFTNSRNFPNENFSKIDNLGTQFKSNHDNVILISISSLIDQPHVKPGEQKCISQGIHNLCYISDPSDNLRRSPVVNTRTF